MSHPEFEYLGPYRVEKTLGRGGMGTVYKGVNAKSGEAVAIKVIATGVANQPRFRRRFAAEIETLKRLKHPNIVTLVGYGEEQGLLFYSMEYVAGHSLHDHLRQHSRLPWEDVVHIGIETASAMKHAHDLGIIHRDLKPANLMLNAEGHAKLTDFGIAKLFGSTDMTAAGSVIGTADFMSPEQAEGKPVTTRSDLYSLGGVLYALLCGKAPFGGKSVPEVLYSVRYSPVPRLSDRVSDVPNELCELVHQLLEKDPAKRPPTALVVGNRLKALQHGMNREATKNGDLNDSLPPVTSIEKIGTRLTSLDLSNVEDDELKLTSEEEQELGLEPSKETQRGGEDLGTHEQQTILAQDNLSVSQVRNSEATSSADEADERLASEFSHVIPAVDAGPEASSVSREDSFTSGGPSHYTPIGKTESVPFSMAGDIGPSAADTDWVQYASMAGIVVLLLGSVATGWWWLQPRPADEIFQKIMAAVDSGDDSELPTARLNVAEFLSRFPDDERRQEIETIADDMELSRWTRVLRRQATREGGVDELSAIEQGFLDCMQARTENAETAHAKLSAFLKVFGPLENLNHNERRLVELAEFATRMGQQVDRKTSIAASQLEDLIRSAENSLSGERLAAYYRDLLLLYSDKAWADEQLLRIRKKLESEP